MENIEDLIPRVDRKWRQHVKKKILWQDFKEKKVKEEMKQIVIYMDKTPQLQIA